MNSSSTNHPTEQSLRVARQKSHSRVLGPGVRAVIWFHGCSLDCPGCIAYEMNRSKTWSEWSPEDLCAWVCSIDEIEGITLSGGDPFDQPAELLQEFLTAVRRESSLSIMCYTGRTYRQLVSGPQAVIHQQILQQCDLLIDGTYDESLNTGHQWRGSSNQQIHYLTDRYQSLARELEYAQDRSIEFDLSLDNQLAITGIPQPGFMESLQEQLARRGVVMSMESRGVIESRRPDQGAQ